MLTTVEVRSATGDLLTLSLDDVSGGIVVAEIEGLDPVKATVITSDIATMDGAHLQKTRRVPRNILMKLDLEPDYSVESIRDLRFRLYDFFMTEAIVNLRFIHSVEEDFEVEISGVVESCETPLFTKEPKLDVSIVCTNPDFVDLVSIEVEGTSVEDTTETLLAYPGSIEAGLEWVMTLDRDIDEVELYLRGPDNITRRFAFGGNFLDGDVITVSSSPGSKSIIVNRSGTLMPWLYGVFPGSVWPTLYKGNNYIITVVEGTTIPYQVTYTPKYGGL